MSHPPEHEPHPGGRHAAAVGVVGDHLSRVIDAPRAQLSGESLGLGEGTPTGDTRDDLACEVRGRVCVERSRDMTFEVGAVPPLLVVEGEACIQDHESRVAQVRAKPFGADDGALVHAVILPVRFVPILMG